MDTALWAAVDLEHGLPDPALLPPLEDAVAAGARTPRSAWDTARGITAQLLAAVEPTWPFPAADWTAAGGGEEGVRVACRAVARPGDVVAVEEPTAPVLVDVLRQARVRVLPVPVGAEGPDPDGLAAALRRRAVAFVCQPGAGIPVGRGFSAERVAELARVVRDSDAVVVEYDALGPLAAVPAPSLGAYVPDRVLHVRSYCAAYGPELRSCVVAGAAELVERARRLHRLDTLWPGRVLQNAQAFLVEDPDTGALLRRARARYARRRKALAEALRAQGVAVDAADGLALWVPAADETRAVISLVNHGVSVGPGARCATRPLAAEHLRVAITRLPDDVGRVAALAGLIAQAVRARVKAG
ncbi:DNA-binding transcriptional MocR family regulator [Amycolatopsis bartoniae]|nr:aminotransferase class I/II-fold pyridoxal phosphate-dependent enzyme [Amycolatopsis bartoniae]MBB2937690.1 DNA-binding transcriptional MocR family regulator [Amycolatopsis bartoniae]TVT08220.1 aminotransferase class I/II-fold pyridoxal phosphate-dependent enzyme [Amycolatopsis bartoniae]